MVLLCLCNVGVMGFVCNELDNASRTTGLIKLEIIKT